LLKSTDQPVSADVVSEDLPGFVWGQRVTCLQSHSTRMQVPRARMVASSRGHTAWNQRGQVRQWVNRHGLQNPLIGLRRQNMAASQRSRRVLKRRSRCPPRAVTAERLALRGLSPRTDSWSHHPVSSRCGQATSFTILALSTGKVRHQRTTMRDARRAAQRNASSVRR
jgi:hypothetical protein